MKARARRRAGEGSGGQRRESTVPAIEHYAHEGGQLSLCPRYGLRTDLLCASTISTHNCDKSTRRAKTCPAIRVKIFRFRRRANQLHNSACLTADEERWP